MKRILLALTMVVFLLRSLRGPRLTPRSRSTFFTTICPPGQLDRSGRLRLLLPAQRGRDNADWRPYADGYWAYTDSGWTWVSYEDFGWATYHYGRWANLAELRLGLGAGLRMGAGLGFLANRRRLRRLGALAARQRSGSSMKAGPSPAGRLHSASDRSTTTS